MSAHRSGVSAYRALPVSDSSYRDEGQPSRAMTTMTRNTAPIMNITPP